MERFYGIVGLLPSIYWEAQGRNSTHFGHCRLFHLIHTLAQSYVKIPWKDYSADLGALSSLQCTKNRKIGASNITLKGRIHSAIHSVWTTLYMDNFECFFQQVIGSLYLDSILLSGLRFSIYLCKFLTIELGCYISSLDDI